MGADVPCYDVGYVGAVYMCLVVFTAYVYVYVYFGLEM